MIGLLIELIISWLLLRLLEKVNLLALGIGPTKERVSQLLTGFLVATSFCTLYFLAIAGLAHNSYLPNKSFTINQFFASSWWTLKSVLFEELIFRGALLYIAIKRFGTAPACILSAIAFGIYHWFTSGALGNPMQMIIVFIMTATWGLMFAFSFAKTNSLYLPVGLHSGWNLVNIVIFSKGPLGQQLFYNTNQNKIEGLLSLLFFIIQIVTLPLLTYFYLRIKTKSNHKSQQETRNNMIRVDN